MEEDRLGMNIVGDVAEIMKDENGHVGISIGGGAPMSPCLYVVQILDGSPVAIDSRIKAGDEIFSINGTLVKGARKTAVASMIQNADKLVKIGFNSLQADPQQGYTLDIALKKAKHRIVEFMNSDTADALGLSRAILCYDLLVKKLARLERNATMHKKLIQCTTALLNAYFHVARSQKEFGDIFCETAARQETLAANSIFSIFGEAHRAIEKQILLLVRDIRPIVSDLNTYVEKAIPDTKLTLRKYLDVKFEYLSFCLKLKEMDDEEIQFAELQEPLHRLETGNYEYRMMLRCRSESRQKFIKCRSDVMVKLELLDQKHVRDIAEQLANLLKAMTNSYNECKDTIEKTSGFFPLEVDLSQIVTKYNTTGRLMEDETLDLQQGNENAKKQSNYEELIDIR